MMPGSDPRRVVAAALVLACALASQRAHADPPLSSLGRVPVCGDAGDGAVQLHCPAFEPLPDIEVFRVPGRETTVLRFDFVFSEANRPNELAVFRADDQRGAVDGISPVESGYLAAALRRATVIFPAGSGPSLPDVTFRATGGDLLVS